MTALDFAKLAQQGYDFSIREMPKGTLRIAVVYGMTCRALLLPLDDLPTEREIEDRLADLLGELRELRPPS